MSAAEPPDEDQWAGTDTVPFDPPKAGESPKPVPAGAKPPSAWARAVTLTSTAELFAPLPPTNWLCEALEMAPGPPAVWAGYGYGGKSYAAQALALAVATGRDVWGSFAVRSGRVLHMDYEQGRSLTAKRYQRLARGMSVGPAELADRLQVAVLPRLNLADGVAERLLLEGTQDVSLCIIDSFRAACPTIDENSSLARAPLDALNRISEANGCTFLLLHHANKPKQDAQGGARMTMRGSGALYDAVASQHIFQSAKGKPTLVHHEKAKITGKTRDDFTLEVRDLLDVDGRFDGVEIVCSAAPDDNQVRNAGLTAIKRRITEYLAENPGAERESIKLRVQGRDSDVSGCLSEMVTEGLVRLEGAGKRGNPFRHWLAG
jgi:hypothetical protein